MTVALSGGPDSTALLLLAVAIARRERPNALVGAVHVHHHLRSSADADALVCEAVCRQLSVPLEVLHVHPGRDHAGLAARARALRHEAIEQAAQRSGLPWVLLGHHADDVLETLLMRLGRGVSARGLAGIPWIRRGIHVREVRVVRPLLDRNRAELEGLCDSCGVSFVRDESNANEATVRGHLRARVIPPLLARWSTIAVHAARACDDARCGHWALGRIARRQGWTGEFIDRAQMRRHGATLSRALLQRAAEIRGIDASPMLVRKAVSAACGRGTSPRKFSGHGVTIEVRAKQVRLTRTAITARAARSGSRRAVAGAGDSPNTP